MNLQSMLPILQGVHPIKASIMFSDAHVYLLERETIGNRVSNVPQTSAERVVDLSDVHGTCRKWILAALCEVLKAQYCPRPVVEFNKY
jgi:hypothetical protein